MCGGSGPCVASLSSPVSVFHKPSLSPIYHIFDKKNQFKEVLGSGPRPESLFSRFNCTWMLEIELETQVPNIWIWHFYCFVHLLRPPRD